MEEVEKLTGTYYYVAQLQKCDLRTRQFGFKKCKRELYQNCFRGIFTTKVQKKEKDYFVRNYDQW